jgi:hypothetical protein
VSAKHADTFYAAIQILVVIERLLRSAKTPASRLAADMIRDILRND